jgi:hypothetical protein
MIHTARNGEDQAITFPAKANIINPIYQPRTTRSGSSGKIVASGWIKAAYLFVMFVFRRDFSIALVRLSTKEPDDRITYPKSDITPALLQMIRQMEAPGGSA